MTQCRFCKSQDMSQHSSAETSKYKGQTYEVLIDYSICNHCGEEVITTDQIHINEMRVREAKKKLDGLLSCEEIRRMRTALGLTQDEAAKVFGGGVNAFSKYERGEVTQSTAMDKLIRIAEKDQMVFLRLKAMAGLSNLVTVTNLEVEQNKTAFRTFHTRAQTDDFSSNDNIYAINTAKKRSNFTLPKTKMA